MAPSKEYRAIIAALDNLKGHCKEMANDENSPLWMQDVWALNEAMDIISDYEKVVAESNKMIKHYETAEQARTVAPEVYTCPHCGKRIHYNHTHCHWCGKKIGYWK